VGKSSIAGGMVTEEMRCSEKHLSLVSVPFSPPHSPRRQDWERTLASAMTAGRLNS